MLSVELDVLLVFPESATTINVLGVFTKCLGTRFLREVAVVPTFGQFATEEVVVGSFVQFLETDNVGILVFDLVEDQSLSIRPAEDTLGNVAVGCLGSVTFAEDVV